MAAPKEDVASPAFVPLSLDDDPQRTPHADIVATCKLNNVDPVAYIAKTLQAILDGHPQSRIDELTPWSFVAASTLAA
ncbi:transposase domain-containing protein [Methylocystis sp. H62]|uniref:transposase domain-containing protein n=1 Tax=Methylocystis sp. H62 TaxID=2785789 RepID=UPI0018C21382|nr:transposase domain-containing protein [Methylocystis sp. H62]